NVLLAILATLSNSSRGCSCLNSRMALTARIALGRLCLAELRHPTFLGTHFPHANIPPLFEALTLCQRSDPRGRSSPSFFLYGPFFLWVFLCFPPEAQLLQGFHISSASGLRHSSVEYQIA